jgi:hypothetical protein
MRAAIGGMPMGMMSRANASMNGSLPSGFDIFGIGRI